MYSCTDGWIDWNHDFACSYLWLNQFCQLCWALRPAGWRWKSWGEKKWIRRAKEKEMNEHTWALNVTESPAVQENHKFLCVSLCKGWNNLSHCFNWIIMISPSGSTKHWLLRTLTLILCLCALTPRVSFAARWRLMRSLWEVTLHWNYREGLSAGRLLSVLCC